MSASTSCDTAIECSLANYELFEGRYPDYTALSYTWGQASRNIPILVNGVRLLITPSLEEAMRQLQKHQRNGTIPSSLWWIDMICIN
jgi:hypothetical protein